MPPDDLLSVHVVIDFKWTKFTKATKNIISPEGYGCIDLGHYPPLLNPCQNEVARRSEDCLGKARNLSTSSVADCETAGGRIWAIAVRCQYMYKTTGCVADVFASRKSGNG
jgi:hypothetical protein